MKINFNNDSFDHNSEEEKTLLAHAKKMHGFSDWVKYQLKMDMNYSQYETNICVGSFVKFNDFGIDVLGDKSEKSIPLENIDDLLSIDDLIENFDKHAEQYAPDPEFVESLRSVWLVENIHIFQQEIRFDLSHKGVTLKEVPYIYIKPFDDPESLSCS